MAKSPSEAPPRDAAGPEHHEARQVTEEASSNEAEQSSTNAAWLEKRLSVPLSSLMVPPPSAEQEPPTSKYEVILRVARTLYQQKNYDDAARRYLQLLQSHAPEEIKKTALLELALIAEEKGLLPKAQQMFGYFTRVYPNDPRVPEVFLRQGIIYRKMGAPTLALAKFYAAMTSSITIQHGSLERYKRLVVQAQTEIADTHYLQGNYEQASDFLQRLLKLESPYLNRAAIEYKYLRCLAALDDQAQLVTRAKQFLAAHGETRYAAEVRFLLARTLKEQGRTSEALRVVLELLESQEKTAATNLVEWTYWRQRAGNEIGNQLYQEGDYLGALQVYTALAKLDSRPAWQLPAWYQVGLSYERLEQPLKAREIYERILARRQELGTNASPALQTLIDMAQWRVNFIDWKLKAEAVISKAAPPTPAPPLAASN